jgi:hypothetical protein
MPWEDDDEVVVTDDDVKYANHVLSQFLIEEKDFAEFLADEKNWDHEGDDNNGIAISHEWVKPDSGSEDGKRGCGCGCAGKGGPDTCSPFKSVEDSLAELQVKVGRSLNRRNAERIAQAIRLLTEVIGDPETAVQRKDDGGVLVAAAVEDLFELREMLEPVIDHYELDAEIDEQGLHFDFLTDAAEAAVKTAIENFGAIQTKGLERDINDFSV